MLKRLSLALAGLFAFVAAAQGAGTIPGFSLTPQFDLTGKVMPGCRLYIIQAGTVSTPQNAYSDSGLTLLLPNPLTCDASGRIGQFFVADGSIKVRLQTAAGTQVFVGDNLLVVGASSGGGGGSPVDPTTILATGDFKLNYGTGNLTGFVRCNGRTIGSATSGATERANSDAQTLFQYFWGVDVNLAVSGGRGTSAAADWASNKALTLPDCRSRAIAGLGDMGNSDNALFSGVTFTNGASTTLGSLLGVARRTLVTANLPPYTPSGTVTANEGSGTLQLNAGGSFLGTNATAGFVNHVYTFTGNAQGGTSTAFDTVSPFILLTTYIKL